MVLSNVRMADFTNSGNVLFGEAVFDGLIKCLLYRADDRSADVESIGKCGDRAEIFLDVGDVEADFCRLSQQCGDLDGQSGEGGRGFRR